MNKNIVKIDPSLVEVKTVVKMTGNYNTFEIMNQEGEIVASINLFDDNERFFSIDVTRNRKNSIKAGVHAGANGISEISTILPENNHNVTILLHKGKNQST